MHVHLYTSKNLKQCKLKLQIATNDEITKEICRGCANRIVDFHEFYLMYVESDRKLRSLNEIDCKPIVDSYEFESEQTLPLEVVAVVKKEVFADSFKVEADDDDSRENDNSTSDQQPSAIIERTKPVNCASEKKQKRLVGSAFECFACHRTYKSIKTVRRHSRICRRTESQPKVAKPSYYQRDTNNQFVCDLCGKCFTTRQSVYAHIQKHVGPKFLCNICGKCLSNRNNLTKHHKTVHLKEKNYQCTTCDKRYDSSYRLRIHQNSHENIRLFGCTLCYQRFITSSALSRHKKTVHKQGELYECNICFRKFNVAYNMRAHMVTHTGIKPHICQYCKADFQRKHKLVTHLKEVHGAQDHELAAKCFDSTDTSSV